MESCKINTRNERGVWPNIEIVSRMKRCGNYLFEAQCGGVTSSVACSIVCALAIAWYGSYGVQPVTRVQLYIHIMIISDAVNWRWCKIHWSQPRWICSVDIVIANRNRNQISELQSYFTIHFIYNRPVWHIRHNRIDDSWFISFLIAFYSCEFFLLALNYFRFLFSFHAFKATLAVNHCESSTPKQIWRQRVPCKKIYTDRLSCA